VLTLAACGGADGLNGGGDGGFVGGARDGGFARSDSGGQLVAYVSGYGPNIGWYSVDEQSGALGSKGSIKSIGNSPSFLAWNRSGTNLYALDEATAGRVAAYAIDSKTGALTYVNDVSSKGNGPAHLSVDATGKWVFVANYGDGTVAVLPVTATGSLADATDTKSPGANAHMIIADPSNKFVFVPCKGADVVAQYVFDATKGTLTPNAVPSMATAKGAGPRHLAFHPNGKWAYLIAENASSVSTLSFDATLGHLAIIDTVSTLPSGFSGSNTGAEIHVHSTGNFVLASNRGDDSIAVFSVDPTSGKLTMLGTTKTGGKTPRAFDLTPGNALLYAANQAGSVTALRLDAKGALTSASTPLMVQAPSFVGVLRLTP